EAGDREERMAGLDVTAVERQSRHDEIARHARHVRQEVGQWHGPAHCLASAAVSACDATTVPRSPFPVPAFVFRCAASHDSMSSGGTSISRSAPCITSWNTGPDTEPP